MPQETKSDHGEVIASGHSTLQGVRVDLADEARAVEMLEKAFDYRGDVTVTLEDGSDVTGYIFDRRRGVSLNDSYVRLMTPTDDTPVRVMYSRIRGLSFSGKDAAHGKSFETWVKKYVEKKLSGQSASIESDPLE